MNGQLQKAFLTAEDVAKLLQVTPQAVYGWARAGRIPHHRFGKNAVRFSQDELQAWIEKTSLKENDNVTFR